MLRRLNRHKAGGNKHLQEKRLKGWLREACIDRDPPPPQPGLLGETGDSCEAHVVTQNYLNRSEMNYLGLDPQRKSGHPEDWLVIGHV